MNYLFYAAFFLTVTLGLYCILQQMLWQKILLKQRTSAYLLKQEAQKPAVKRTFQLLVLLKQWNGKIARLSKTGNRSQAETLLQSSGVSLTPNEYFMFQRLSALIAAGLFYFFFGQALFILPGLVVGFLIPGWWVRNRRRKRISAFNKGLPDLIVTISGALRAGLSFLQALKIASDDSEFPIKDEIQMILKEIQYGKSLEDALDGMLERVPSKDLELMIDALLIQKQVGGNLASILDIIGQTIRDRIKIQQQVATLTSQGRLSGYVIGSLPIAIGAILLLIQPGHILFLFNNTIGNLMLIACVLFEFIGFIIIRKITRIEV